MSLVTKRRAIQMGKHAGINAVSWAFDGNTTDETYKDFLRGNEEGDPAILDRYAAPDWLSGEWAGGSITEILGDCADKRDEDRLEGVIDAYCEAADRAYYRELERIARRMTR